MILCYMAKKVSISDVARGAGVSKTTVSRVMNKPELVNKLTRERVENIINEYNYIPSYDARNFSKQLSTIFCVIVPEISNTYWSKFIQEISKLAMQNNLITVCFSSEDSTDTELLIFDKILKMNIAGIFYAPCKCIEKSKAHQRVLASIKSFKIPIILVDRRADHLGCPGVYFDDFTGVYTATRKLIANGHTKIAIIGGSQDLQQTLDRLSGYTCALVKNKVSWSKKCIYLGDYTEDFSYSVSKKFLLNTDRPTAVICMNNSLTLGLLKAMREVGFKTGKDLTVVGLDEIKMLEYAGLELTFIRRDSSVLAKASMYLMLEKLEADTKKQLNIINIPLPVHRYMKPPEFKSVDTYMTLPNDSFLFETDLVVSGQISRGK